MQTEPRMRVRRVKRNRSRGMSGEAYAVSPYGSRYCIPVIIYVTEREGLFVGCYDSQEGNIFGTPEDTPEQAAVSLYVGLIESHGGIPSQRYVW